MDAFQVIPAQGPSAPLLISVPHCGVAFPDDLIDEFDAALIRSPVDTDWFVDQLYAFAPSMGISVVKAAYSRWVIDLNRSLTDQPLYSDGRLITTLCPTTTFLGEPLYVDKRSSVATDQVIQRVARYYQPYHDELRKQLDLLRERYDNVLLWDCHSIRRHVPTIQRDPFPDLILGSADGTSASPGLIETALATLDHSRYSVSHNHPFKGGTITRTFGRPADGFHALQLEMNKDLYLDDAETAYDPGRASAVCSLLEQTLDRLVTQLTV